MTSTTSRLWGIRSTSDSVQASDIRFWLTLGDCVCTSDGREKLGGRGVRALRWGGAGREDRGCARGYNVRLATSRLHSTARPRVEARARHEHPDPSPRARVDAARAPSLGWIHEARLAACYGASR